MAVKAEQITCGRGNRIGKFLELGNKETVHVVGVRVEAPGGAQCGVKAPFSKAGKALLAKLQASGHQPHVPLFQGVVYHPLILFHLDMGNRAGGNEGAGAETQVRLLQPPWPALQRSHRDGAGAVDQVASGLGGRVDGVYSTEQQFLLKVGTAQDVLLILPPRDQE